MINLQLFKQAGLLVCFFLPFMSIAQTESGTDTIVLKKGLWVSGLEGGMSNSSIGNTGGSLGDEGFKYTFNFNSGVFVKENLACGLNFRLTKASRTYNKFYTNEEEVYFGPWLRYYFKFQNNWYVYPELGLSYGGFYSEYISTIDNEVLLAKGNGPGVNPGIGVVYFVSQSSAFTIRWNYQANIFSGKTDVVTDLGTVSTVITDVFYANSTLLFGFQLYINEFFF
tara:strand:+ start:10027 stop:10701 length:675 start_codon:yes stop_codon:yes gene_type:complete